MPASPADRPASPADRPGPPADEPDQTGQKGRAADPFRGLALLLAIGASLPGIAFLVIGVIFFLPRPARNPPGQWNKLLEWTDPHTRTAFAVFGRQGAAVRYFSELRVTRGGARRARLLDDDARFGTVSLLRYGRWLLVLNDRYVLGGYDFQADALYGQHDWEKLPFTVHGGGGTIVARRVIGDFPAVTPARFPLIPEPAATTAPGPGP